MAAAPLSIVALILGCNSLLGNTDGVLYVADAGESDAGSDATTRPADASSDVAAKDRNAPDAPPSDAADGSVDASPSCDAAPATPAEASVPTLCPGGIVYVSPNGNDASDGCTPCTPKLSIRSAVDTTTAALALLDGGLPPTDAASAEADAGDAGPSAPVAIHVCAGSYPEVGLLLTAPISILGGYDCATWTRAANYGYPSFGSTDVTVVSNGDFLQQNNTLEVRGAQIGRGTVLDGLTILGATEGSGATSTIYDHYGASPTISNDILVGPSVTSASTNNGVALYVGDTASPDVHDDRISGGGGTTTGNGFQSVASTGVWISTQGGLPHIHHNTISGGPGNAPAGNLAHGSVAIFVGQCGANLTVASGSAIESNVIDGGTGTFATGGVILAPNTCSVDVIDNTITGGTTAPGGAFAVGVDVRTASPVHIERNRIVGGLSTDVAGSYGVNSVQQTDIVLSNNMIHAGFTKNFAAGALIYGWVAGTGTTSYVVFNTIFGGQSTTQPENIQGIGANEPPAALGVAQGPVSISSNILIGGGSTTASAGLGSYFCQSANNPAIPQFTSNLIFNVTGGILATGQPCQGSTSTNYPTIVDAEEYVNASTAAMGEGNLTLMAACAGGDPTCLQVPACDGTTANEQACLEHLFTQWSADGGSTTLVPPGPGWVLGSATPCAIAKGGVPNPNAPTPTDLFGTMRPTQPSMGADQFTGTCQ